MMSGVESSPDKEYGRPTVASQASNTDTLEKPGLLTILPTKPHPGQKTPLEETSLTNTTAIIGLRTIITGSTPCSHSGTGLPPLIDFCKTR